MSELEVWWPLLRTIHPREQGLKLWILISPVNAAIFERFIQENKD